MTDHNQLRVVVHDGELFIEGHGRPVVFTNNRNYAQDDADQHIRRLAACWNAFEGIPTEKFEGKDIAEYVAGEAYITGMQPAAGGMELGLQGLGVQLLGATLAGTFKANGAINFFEVSLSHPETGPLLVTLQRLHGETPAQQKAAAIAERDALAEQLTAAKAREAQLVAGLEKIIEMNRQHALDQYGDANKAESWSCIRVAREALATDDQGGAT